MTDRRLRRIADRFRRRIRRLLVEMGVLRLVFFSLSVTLLLVLSDWYFRDVTSGH